MKNYIWVSIQADLAFQTECVCDCVCMYLSVIPFYLLQRQWLNCSPSSKLIINSH